MSFAPARREKAIPALKPNPARPPPTTPPPDIVTDVMSKSHGPVTFETSITNLGMKKNGENGLGYIIETLFDNNYISERKDFLRKNIPYVDSAVIETRELQKMLSPDTKKNIKAQINIVNTGMESIWPKIGDKSSLVPKISTTQSLLGGKRTRRARIGSNKTKHRRRNQYKR
jgi:hypothetical protein